MRTLGAHLDAARSDDRRRWLLSIVGAICGLALTWIHWLGIVVGGALVALPQVSLRRGVLAGVGFGVLTILVVGLWLATAGTIDTYLAMGRVLGISTAIPLAFALLGSLARGLR